MSAMTIRFCGEGVSSGELELIEGVVRSCCGLSRAELAHTVCELLEWRRANGALKARECRELLERLERQGALKLPAKHATKAKGTRTRVPRTARGERGAPVRGALSTHTPIELTVVREAQQRTLWRELVGRYHYQGHAVPYGAQLRYLVSVSRPQPQVVGCLQFSSAAWRMAARDGWIGWDDAQRTRALQRVVNNSRFLLLPWVEVRYLASAVLARATRALQRVVNNSRFLLLPWVEVRYLASAVLARAARRLPGDWQAAYAVRPLLLETLVDSARFAGTCYRAANWLAVGTTSGRGRMDRAHRRHGRAPKAVWVYPLCRDARERLRGEPHAVSERASALA
jgi:hypothetical protein